MNTNPKAKRILVYGDSLPWGLISGSRSFERFPGDVRWPGALQKSLGDGFEVIEECLCARTIDADDARPGFEGRNGLTYLLPTLDSHDPIDLVVIALGLNEVKSIFAYSAKDVAGKLENMIKLVQFRKPNFHDVNTRVLLVAPPTVEEARATGFWGELWSGSEVKSKELGKEFYEVADKLGSEFIDLAEIVKAGVDGVHLDAEAHNRIANEVAGIIKRLW